ncbi:V-type proton ATPase subunit S1-like [Lissotriton helveticus]
MLLERTAALCSLLLVFLPLGAVAEDHVPVLLWSTRSSMWDRTALTHEGHITSGRELHALLQPVLQQNPPNLVLFLQDSLSVDDFTYLSAIPEREKPLHNIQEILQSSESSLVLPAVAWEAVRHLSDYLQKKADWHLLEMSDVEASDFKPSASKPNLIVVNLQSTTRGSGIPDAWSFAENDEKIGKLTTILREKEMEFSAIYSALRPSKIHSGFHETSARRRRLMAEATVVDTVPYPPMNVTNGTNTCIIFYATNISMTVNGTIKLDLTNKTFVSGDVDTNSSDCSPGNTTFSLKYYNLTTDIRTLEIRFAMSNQFYTGSARNWFTVDNVQIIENNNAPGALFSIPYASSPAEYSFHCQLVGTSALSGAVMTPSNAAAKNWDVSISGFQIQGFHVQNSLFSYAADCTGFFSAAIWMALVSSLILLWILAYGIYMLMQLTTNDKFDDPRGQTLSVSQTE